MRFLKDKLHIYVKELKDEKIQQALKRFYYKQCKSLVERVLKRIKVISKQNHVLFVLQIVVVLGVLAIRIYN